MVLSDGLQMDIRAAEKSMRDAAAKLVSLRSMVAGLGLEKGTVQGVCEECGLGRGQHLASCSLAPTAGPDLTSEDVAAARFTAAMTKLNARHAARLARGAAAEREDS